MELAIGKSGRGLMMAWMVFYAIQACSQSDQFTDYISQLDPNLEVSIMAERSDGTIIFEHNAQRSFPSASVIKIPILIELLRQVENEELSLSDTYTLMDRDKVGGAGELMKLPAGRILTLGELAIEMIRVSDNTATNILIEKLGMDRINAFLEENGFRQTRLRRLMMDFEAIKEGRQNYTTSMEMNHLLRLLFSGQLLGAENTARAIDILLLCEDSTTIPRFLPKEVNVAHKSGTLEYVRGDAGIIYASEPVILTVFVEDFSTLDQAEMVIADLARLIYDRSK